MSHYMGPTVYSRISMDLGRVTIRRLALPRYKRKISLSRDVATTRRVLTLVKSIDSRRFTADSVKSCAKFREVRTIEAGKERL